MKTWKYRFLPVALALLLLGTFGLAPLSASATHNPLHQIAVTGTGTLNGVAGTFTGTLDVVRFVNSGGDLVAIGRLTGTFTAENGLIRQVTNEIIRVLVTIGDRTCEILELNIGAIHLDLLGLVLDISPIDITLVAEGGPGNLLGNLLCAIAHLLDGGGPLGSLANLLNRILSILG